MINKPVFTVIVPTYNREHILKRTINSILAQTLKEFELIIVDDGSTDDTEGLVKTYNDDRIIYIYKENGGHNSARNRALQDARGEYIAFCDSDDRWLPEKLEEHIKKYDSDNEIKVVYDLTGVVVTENGEKKIVPARNDVCEGWCYKEVLEQGYLTSPSFLSCKKECFDKIGFMPMDLTNCEDDDLCFCLCRYFKVGLIKKVLGIYGDDASNRISLMKKLCADDFLRFLEKWKSEIIKVCGKDILRQKYYQALNKYMEINETDMAREMYDRACKMNDTSIEEIKDRVKRMLRINEKIIIYGMGEWGKKVYYALKMIGFNEFIFTVTNGAQSKNIKDGVAVKEIGDLGAYIHIPLIIASSKYHDDMNLTAKGKGFVNIIFYKEVMDIIFY